MEQPEEDGRDGSGAGASVDFHVGRSVGKGVEVWGAGWKCSVYAMEQFKEDW